MKSRKNDHGDPKPHMPFQLPPQCDCDNYDHCRGQRWTSKIELAEVIEQDQHRETAQYDAKYAPPRQAHLPVFFGEDFLGIASGHRLIGAIQIFQNRGCGKSVAKNRRSLCETNPN